MIKVWSYDVFDTCLIRKCACPTDAFRELALELRSYLEPELGTDFVENFVAARIVAERQARMNANEEVTLEEIWKQLSGSHIDIDPAIGVRNELIVEERLLSPNGVVLELCQEHQARGDRLVFISDTYYPESFVRSNLQKYGFANGHAVYVSSETMLTKQSGSLYSYVLGKENILSSQLVHRGDNNESDYRIPRAMGINVIFDHTARLNHIERKIVSHIPSHEILTRLTGEMRAFRLRPATREQRVSNYYVASFLGPFLLAFASWVLASARRDGVRRLYFFSRDCYLLCKVASSLAPDFGNIDCRYLQVSRQSLFFPTITELSADAMSWFRRSFEKHSLKRLLAKLELSLSDIDASLFSYSDDEGPILKEDHDWELFWQQINREPLRSAILSKVMKRREAALAYFKEQGLCDTVKWAVVDIGWYLTCQKYLKELLQLQHPAVSVKGYYLGLFLERSSQKDAGEASALFYMPPDDLSVYIAPSSVFERIALLEHLIGCAPHGTVNHYEISSSGNVKVVSAHCSGELKGLSVGLSESVIDFCSSNRDLSKPLSLGNNEAYVIDTVTREYFSNPERGSVELLRPTYVSNDQNNAGASPLVKPVGVYDIALIVAGTMLKRFMTITANRSWPEGDVAISGTYINKLSIIAMKVRKILIKSGLMMIN